MKDSILFVLVMLMYAKFLLIIYKHYLIIQDAISDNRIIPTQSVLIISGVVITGITILVVFVYKSFAPFKSNP